MANPLNIHHKARDLARNGQGRGSGGYRDERAI